MFKKLFATITGKPTLGGMVDELLPYLRVHHPGPWEFNERQASLRASGDAPMLINLANLFVNYSNAPKGERASVLDRFARGMVAQANTDFSVYENARRALLPILRTAEEVSISSLYLEVHVPPEHRGRPFEQAARPHVGHLMVCLALDTPNATQRVDSFNLSEWGVSWDMALADALENLRALPAPITWEEVAPGVQSLQCGDSYESSRLLLPDVIHRANVLDPVVMIPIRNGLLVASARSDAALRNLVEKSGEARAQLTRQLSMQAFSLQGDAWTPFIPQVGVGALFSDVMKTEEAEGYANQKSEIEALHERDGTDIFVATQQLMKDPAGKFFSMATLTQGVDTLLPSADRIVLLRLKDDQPNGQLMVTWADFYRTCAALLEELPMRPARYRVRRFVTEAQWDVLRECAMK